MGGPWNLLRFGAVFLFALAVFGGGVLFSPAAARPTVGFFPAAVSEVETAPRARPCEMAAAMMSVGEGGVGGVVEKKGVKLAENYASLLLNALPRGKLPPSGPSKGHNDAKE